MTEQISEERFRLVPNPNQNVDGSQYGWTLERDGEPVLRVITGGTGPCWNLDLLGDEENFGPLAGSDGEVHVCELDEFIAVLEFLRGSEVNRQHQKRWRRSIAL